MQGPLSLPGHPSYPNNPIDISVSFWEIRLRSGQKQPTLTLPQSVMVIRAEGPSRRAEL